MRGTESGSVSLHKEREVGEIAWKGQSMGRLEPEPVLELRNYELRIGLNAG